MLEGRFVAANVGWGFKGLEFRGLRASGGFRDFTLRLWGLRVHSIVGFGFRVWGHEGSSLFLPRGLSAQSSEKGTQPASPNRKLFS